MFNSAGGRKAVQLEDLENKQEALLRLLSISSVTPQHLSANWNSNSDSETCHAVFQKTE